MTRRKYRKCRAKRPLASKHRVLTETAVLSLHKIRQGALHSPRSWSRVSRRMGVDVAAGACHEIKFNGHCSQRKSSQCIRPRSKECQNVRWQSLRRHPQNSKPGGRVQAPAQRSVDRVPGRPGARSSARLAFNAMQCAGYRWFMI